MTNDDIIDELNDLTVVCKDGEYGFSVGAEHARSPELKTLFDARAQDCAQAAQELQALVLQYGGQPETGGSASGTAHRGWVTLRSVVTEHTDIAMLEECERGEDKAVEAYRSALKQPLPTKVLALVERQFRGAKANHDEVRAARDRLRGQHGEQPAAASH